MRLLLLIVALVLALPAQAQHDPAQHAAHAGAQTLDGLPTGLTSAERDGLLAGAGLGLAKAAELNGYPGPLHVLELADALALTDAQRETAERLRAEMLEAAVPLGRQIVEAERQLDDLFENGTATPIAIAKQAEVVAGLRGRLRAVHLAAHVGMRAALAPEQRAAYGRLRGYTDA